MAFQKALDDVQRKELVEDYRDNIWSINDLSVIYRISHRTVYRILAEHDVPLRNSRKRRTRGKSKPKPRELKPCGTNAAYARHKAAGEYPCTPCLEAHARDVKKAKEKGKKK